MKKVFTVMLALLLMVCESIHAQALYNVGFDNVDDFEDLKQTTVVLDANGGYFAATNETTLTLLVNEGEAMKTSMDASDYHNPVNDDETLAFGGWSLAADGSADLQVVDLQQLVPEEDMTLYAVWEMAGEGFEEDSSYDEMPPLTEEGMARYRIDATDCSVYGNIRSIDADIYFDDELYQKISLSNANGWVYSFEADPEKKVNVKNIVGDYAFSFSIYEGVTDDAYEFTIWATSVKVTAEFDANGGYFENGETTKTIEVYPDIPKYEFVAQPVYDEENTKVLTGWAADPEGLEILTDERGYFRDRLTPDFKAYAVWGDPFTVTFDCNGGYFSDTGEESKTVKGAGNALIANRPENPVYDGDSSKRFVGWASDPEGNNMMYFSSDDWNVAIISSDTTVYAIWENTYNIVFDANGGYFPNTRETVETIKATDDYFFAQYPSRPVYDENESKYFYGWASDVEGKTIVISRYNDIIQNFTEDATVYAAWMDIIEVEFDANGGYFTDTGETVEKRRVAGRLCIDGLPSVVYDEDESNGFYGWASDSEGENPVEFSYGVQFGDTFEYPKVYAVWKKPIELTLNANGGYFPHTGATTEVIKANDAGTLYQEPSKPVYGDNSKYFNGWALEPEGSTIVIDRYGNNYQGLEEDTELYAVWLDMAWVEFDANGGYFSDTGETSVTYPVVGRYWVEGQPSFPVYDQARSRRFMGWSTDPEGEERVHLYYGGIDEEPFAYSKLYAVWSQPFNITLHANGGHFPETNEDTTVVNMTTYTDIGKDFPVPVYDEYGTRQFQGWSQYSFGSEIIENLDNYCYNNGYRDIDLYAVWTTYQYVTVTFDFNGGLSRNGSETEAVSVRLGDSVPSNLYDRGIASQFGVSYSDSSYGLAGWSYERNGELAIYDVRNSDLFDILDYAINEDVTLYAVWVKMDTLTLDATAGIFSSDGTSKKEIKFYENLPLLVVNNNLYSPYVQNYESGLSFVGWSEEILGDNGVCSWNDIKDKMIIGHDALKDMALSQDTTLYAVWAKKAFDVTLDANGGYFPDSGKETMVYSMEDTYSKLPTPVYDENDSRSFLGWSCDPNSYDRDIYAYLRENNYVDVVLYATWASYGYYTVTLDLNGGTTSDGQTKIVLKVAPGESFFNQEYNSDFSREGYQFGGWTKAMEDAKPTDETAAESGFTVKSGDGNSYPAYSYPQGDTTYYAIWKKEITVVLDATQGYFHEEAGDVQTKEYTVSADEKFHYLPNPYTNNQDLQFVGWSKTLRGDNGISDSKDYSDVLFSSLYEDSWVLQENTTVYAVWDDGTYTYELDANGGYFPETKETVMALQANRGEYIYCEDLPVPENADPSRHFVGWAEENNSSEKLTSTYYSTQKRKYTNVKFYAIWKDDNELEADTYRIVLDLNGGTTADGMTKIERTVEKGMSLNLFEGMDEWFSPMEGFIFRGWAPEKNKEAVFARDITNNHSSYYFTPNNDMLLYADWQRVIKATLDATDGVLFDNRYPGYYNASRNLGRVCTLTFFSDLQTYYETPIIVKSSDPELMFAGWSRTPTGEVEIKDIQDLPDLKLTSNTILYAIWSKKDIALTLDYNGGNVAGESTTSYSMAKGVSYGELYSTALETPSREGYSFQGWAFDPSASYVLSNDELSTYRLNGDKTAYAIWTDNAQKIKVTFDYQGKVKNLENKTFECIPDEDVSELFKEIDCSPSLLNDLTVIGWSETSGGEVKYSWSDKQIYFDKDTTLYAVYSEAETIKLTVVVSDRMYPVNQKSVPKINTAFDSDGYGEDGYYEKHYYAYVFGVPKGHESLVYFHCESDSFSYDKMFKGWSLTDGGEVAIKIDELPTTKFYEDTILYPVWESKGLPDAYAGETDIYVKAGGSYVFKPLYSPEGSWSEINSIQTNDAAVARMVATDQSDTYLITGGQTGDADISFAWKMKANPYTTSYSYVEKRQVLHVHVTDDAPILPTKLALDKRNLDMKPGEEKTLVASVQPKEADQTVTWKSSNESVATVDENGKIAAMQEGTTSIAAITSNGITTECRVTVANDDSFVELLGITLDFTELTLSIGNTRTLVATPSPKNASEQSVIWTSSDESVATVSEEGIVTAVKAGSAVITASVPNGKKAECTIYVMDEEGSVLPAEVILSKSSMVIKPGYTQVITAEIKPYGAKETSIAWKSSDESIATIDAHGRITAVKEGVAVITATTDNGVMAECRVIVSNEEWIEPSGIVLDLTGIILPQGNTQVLKATVLPANASDASVTWSSSDESIATVDKDGKVTAVDIGNVVITASTANKRTATCTVEVIQRTVKVTAVTLDKTTAELTVGETLELKATIQPEDATHPLVTWKSSDESIAKVDKGKVTAIAVGKATITASVVDGLTAECTITVKDNVVEVTGLALSSTSASLKIGETVDLTVSVEPENATDKSIAWSSSDTSVAMVDKDGKVTAIAKGTAVVTATSSNGKTAQCTITVEDAIENVAVTGVTITPSSSNLKIGETVSLTATVEPENATEKSVSWSSSDPMVATVDKDGKVAAIAKGTAVITASTANGKSATSNILVEIEMPIGCELTGFCLIKYKYYWYENGVRQGTYGDPLNITDTIYGIERGREIYDFDSKEWYWLDAVYEGAKAANKEVWMPYVYKEEEPGSTDGKWVRYDDDGAMAKGWYTISTAKDRKLYPDQIGNTYYYDLETGAMAKGTVTIDGETYEFNRITGVLAKDSDNAKASGYSVAAPARGASMRAIQDWANENSIRLKVKRQATVEEGLQGSIDLLTADGNSVYGTKVANGTSVTAIVYK